MAVVIATAGFLLGSTHDNTAIAGIIPNSWIEWAVGGNSLLSNFFASFTGAFMYFATLTEVPIIQGLLASGMGKVPAEYARYPWRYGTEENNYLCFARYRNGDNLRICVRNYFLEKVGDNGKCRYSIKSILFW